MSALRVALLLVAAITMVGCARSLSQEELAVLEQLTLERASLQSEIAAAETEAAKYNGGLVVGLIRLRIETLKSTDALIHQRIHAVQSGAPMTVSTPVSVADPQRSAELLVEIRNQEADLERARTDDPAPTSRTPG